jgi:uncharacterized protein (DUF4213/DUF364 family)
VPDAGRLAEHSAQELAKWLRSPSTLQASIGMAAFNALLEVDQAACTEVNAREVILSRGTGRRVAFVGHFPFTEKVREVAAQCWVLELHPRAGDLRADKAAEILPQAEVVALSGTSLINHTYDGLIGLCHPDAFVLLLGGSAPLTSVLFQCGADAVAGTQVVDAAAASRTIAEGATFPQIGGKRLLTMTRHGV